MPWALGGGAEMMFGKKGRKEKNVTVVAVIVVINF